MRVKKKLGLSSPGAGGGQRTGGARVLASRSQLLWKVLEATYAQLGLDAVGGEAFKAVVLGRIIEPVHKADTLGVLEDVGVSAPSLPSLPCLGPQLSALRSVTIDVASRTLTTEPSLTDAAGELPNSLPRDG